MQAIEKTLNSDYWITIVLLVMLLLIFLMKVVDQNLLNQHIKKFFQVPFVPLETEDSIGIFNTYQVLIFILNTIAFSILVSYVSSYFNENEPIYFPKFLFIFLGTLLYFLLKWILEYLISILFLMKKSIKLFVISKWNYLFSLSIYISVVIVFHEFAQVSLSFLFYLIGFFLLLRFVFVIITNKKLIFNKLFYFILYLCAFEIAPLFILFKSVI